MSRFLLIALTFSIVSLNAQTAPFFSLSSGVAIDTASPQQLADAIGAAVKADPARSSEIFDAALNAVNHRSSTNPQDGRNAVAAITCALVASVPEKSLPEIFQSTLARNPDSTLIVLSALSAIKSQKNKKNSFDSRPAMYIGNIRVLKIEGGKVEMVDENGVASALKEGSFIRQGSKIVTGKNASVDLLFENGSVLQIKPGTEFHIDQFFQTAFDAESVNYQKPAHEPGFSRISLSLPDGKIDVNVAKLNKGSRFEVETPLGTAGIRGTTFYVTSQKTSDASPVAIGVAEGAVQFTNTIVNSRSIKAGEAFGVSKTPTGVAFMQNPPGSAGQLEASLQTALQIRDMVANAPFQGVPPPVAAPASPLSKLSAARQGVLEQAESLGAPVLLQAVLKLAEAQPDFAPFISAAAAELSPGLAVDLAVEVSRYLPEKTSQIGAAIANSVPQQAPAVASALATLMPNQGLVVVAAISRAVPSRASEIASSVAGILPNQAVAIVTLMAKMWPSQTEPIAQSVSLKVPSQGDSINAALNAANGSGDAIDLSNGGLDNQNPGALNEPSPTPAPSPSPNIRTSPVSPSA